MARVHNVEQIKLTAIPAELQKYRQWMVWNFEIREGQQTKVPHQIGGKNASTMDADTWDTYEAVLKAYLKGGFDGIGFVVTPTDKFCGIDMDHCRDAQTGVIEPKKLEYIKLLDSYTEITPSNTGVRVWIKARIPEGGGKRNDTEHIEIYEQGRFFTVTGNHLQGTKTTIEQRQNELTQLHASIFPTKIKANKGNGHKAPVDLADTELIAKAMAAKNGPSFKRLWNGDIGEYDNDDSRADLALCSMLAFWAGNDESHIDSLFRQSGLYREKWERKDYRTRTITTAISGKHSVYYGNNTCIYNSFVTPSPTRERDRNVTDSVTSEAKPTLENVTTNSVTSADRVKEWIKGTTSWWATDELDRDLGITSSKDKDNRRQILLRLREQGFIEPHPKVNKQFRYVNTKVTSLNFKTATDSGSLFFKWPFELERLVNLYPGNVACIAGATNAGKTGLILNTIRLNQDNFPIYYICSEMGDVELRSRLDQFPGMDINDWHFEAIERSSNFADVIRPDCVNIVDYLEMTEELYLVNNHLTAISHKLGSGIAIVALQKKENAKYGRGQEFSAKKTKLYLSLDKGKLSIVKGKSWALKNVDPQGLFIEFTIKGGCLFEPLTGWRRDDGTEVFKPANDLLIPKTQKLISGGYS